MRYRVTMSNFKKEVGYLAKGLDTTQINEEEKKLLIRSIQAARPSITDAPTALDLINAQEMDEHERSRQIKILELERKQAMDKLIGACLYYVYVMAKGLYFKMSKRDIVNVDIMDLMQSGIEGIYIAADKFELDRNLSFLTYASWWIRQTMQKSILSSSWIVKDGYGWRGIQNNIGVVWLDELDFFDGETGNAETLKNRLDESTVGGASKLASFLATSPDYESSKPRDMDANLMLRDILTISSFLPLRERFVFESVAAQNISYAAVGRMIGMSRERIRLVHRKAITTVINRANREDYVLKKRIWTPSDFNICLTEGCGNLSIPELGGNAFRCKECFDKFRECAILNSENDEQDVVDEKKVDDFIKAIQYIINNIGRS